MKLKAIVKRLIYPGVNLHARLRYRRLPVYFGASRNGKRLDVLDAGCGNGMLAYQAWRKGNTVIGISFKATEVSGSHWLFNDYRGIPESQLSFVEGNLYALVFPPESFDEIICSETLEHLRQDELVCRSFWRLLKPGGVLHLCAPNAAHPYNAAFPLDSNEQGGHVRAGYTLETWKALLEPIGFSVDCWEGLGGPIRQFFNRRIKETQERFGAWAGVPLFLVAQLFLPFERRTAENRMPFSVYVRVKKPVTEG